MKKLSSNQRGFSHHFLLPVIVIVAIAGIGTYVLQRSRAAANVYDDAKTTLVKKQEDPKRGLVYTGLRAVKKGSNHPCAGLFEIQRKNPKDPIRCTHGPDPAIEGRDITQIEAIDKKVDSELIKTVQAANAKTPVSKIGTSIEKDESAETTAAARTSAAAIWDQMDTTDIAKSSRLTNKCVDDGQSGRRIVMIYAYEQGHDYYSTVEPVMQQLTQAMQATFAGNSLNSAPSGAQAKVLRFRHDANCKPIIFKIKLPGTAMQTFDTISDHLSSIGYNRDDRKYVVWAENPFNECGRGTHNRDITANALLNENNFVTGLAVVGKGCWSLGTTLHELMHTFGSVQSTATHYDGGGHCYEEQDIVCYTSPTQINTCGTDHITVGVLAVYNLDCQDNDYWAPTTSKLSGQWNTYKSAWLTTDFR